MKGGDAVVDFGICLFLSDLQVLRLTYGRINDTIGRYENIGPYSLSQ